MTYLFDYVPDDNGTLLVTCKKFPEITTFSEDRDSLCLHALGALEEAVAARIAAGADIPEPATAKEIRTVGHREDGSGRIWVKLPATNALKVELYRALRGAGINRAELARRLNWNRESVDRLFRLDHRSRVEQLEKALGELGREIDVRVRQRA
ncbi:MAG TPA: type II toxin-antitoxin system HicB family antitoxin [Beijerinckiaceae bacterium]|jgi:antitoxin HicB